MKLPKVVINKIPITYESTCKYSIQTKLILLWWKLRLGRIILVKVKCDIRIGKDFKFFMIVMPEFEEGVVDG